ncbi:2791_t:CDS:2, partial [Ambispora leptoticha]
DNPKNIEVPRKVEKNQFVKDTDEKEEVIITIKNENEIFIQRPLAINNLADNLQSQQTITNLQEERDNLTSRLTQLNQLLKGSAIIFGKQQNYINQLTHQLQQEQNNITNSTEYNANLRQDLLTLAHTRKELQNTAFYTEDTPAVNVLIEEVRKLFLTKGRMENERDDYRDKWDNSLEELKQKKEIIDGFERERERLENEREQLNNVLQNQLNNLGDYIRN